jgi:hypothetical protein
MWVLLDHPRAHANSPHMHSPAKPCSPTILQLRTNQRSPELRRRRADRERLDAERASASPELWAKALGVLGLPSPSRSRRECCAWASWRRERKRDPTFSTRGEYAGLRDLSNDCAGLWDSGVWSAASPALGALPLGAPRQQQGFGVLLFIAEAFPNGTSEELAAFMDRG